MTALLDFDEASHTYSVGGVIVPGVTRIIEPLRSWEGVPPDLLERKSTLGRAVHLATEYDDKGTLDPESLSGEVAGYLEGWRRFRRETGFAPTLIERKVYHPVMGFAGTLDREGDFGGQITIIDLKSGAKHRVHGVQIAGYALARKQEAGWITYPQRLAVYLTADGRYEIETYTRTSDYPTFIGLLAVNTWRANA